MSEILTSQVNRLKAKVLQLQKVHQSLKKESELQKRHINALKDDASLLQESIKQLQEQNYILKSSTGKMSEDEKKSFEQSINKYVREIDKCLALLND